MNCRKQNDPKFPANAGFVSDYISTTAALPNEKVSEILCNICLAHVRQTPAPTVT